jgi:hypothetical protein
MYHVHAADVYDNSELSVEYERDSAKYSVGYSSAIFHVVAMCFRIGD